MESENISPLIAKRIFNVKKFIIRDAFRNFALV